jgi:arogenate dehydrogenase (NADP+)
MRQTSILFLPLLFCCELFLCSALAKSSPSFNNSNKFDRLDQNRLEKLQIRPGVAGATFSMMSTADGANHIPSPAGRLEELKQQEATLAKQLAAIRVEKLSALKSRPLTIGIIGFGRFGQFIARTFAKHGKVVVTSRSDYTAVASGMGVTYIPLDQPDEFLNQGLDVVIVATSILSFESTILKLVSPLQRRVDSQNKMGPLVVDDLSVKEHARQTMLKHLPEECDILCTHPMFGPDSGRNGWQNLNFVYEKTRVDKVVFDPSPASDSSSVDNNGHINSVHEEDSDAHVQAMDRIERFLSIWEEEGCRMVPMSCKAHDAYAANSQFITHLMGRILGAQGLSETPIDTKGFESVLRLVDSTTADSFDLFYGLYKFNQKNSMETIKQLRAAMDDVCANLKRLEDEDKSNQQAQEQVQQQQPM